MITAPITRSMPAAADAARRIPDVLETKNDQGTTSLILNLSAFVALHRGGGGVDTYFRVSLPIAFEGRLLRPLLQNKEQIYRKYSVSR